MPSSVRQASIFLPIWHTQPATSTLDLPCSVHPTYAPHINTIHENRENAEAIAFYGGDVRESRALSARLALVLHVLLQRIAWLGGYELWLVVYRCVGRLWWVWWMAKGTRKAIRGES